MTYILIWLAFALAVGMFAGSRGRSGFGWFLLAAIISPLLAFILCAVMGNLKDAAAQQAAIAALPSEKTHVRCPQCAEFVLPQAKVCKHCGAALTPATTPPPVAVPPPAGAAGNGTNETVYLVLPWLGVCAVGLVVWWFSK